MSKKSIFNAGELNGFLGKAFKEQSGVLSSLKAALSLFANPLVDRATSSTDFDPRELRRRPTDRRPTGRCPGPALAKSQIVVIGTLNYST